MRDLMVLGAMFLILPLALSNTFIVYLLWGWASLIGLDSYLYGFMGTMPYVQIFAIMTLIMILMRRDKEQVFFKPNRTTVLLVIFVTHALLVASFAFEGLADNWDIFNNIWKLVLYCLIMPMLITSRLRIHALVLSIVFALSFHGLLEGLKLISSGGAHIAQGVRFGDNNFFALVLITVIPLLFYLFRYSTHKWIKYGFLGLVFLTVLAVVATRSRGGFLTLLFVGVILIWQGRRKFVGLITLTIITFLVLSIADNSWMERMSTVEDVSADASFMTRVAVWKKSTAIALDNPFFGGGFNAVQSMAAFAKYQYSQGLMGFIATPDAYRFVAHSIYFQVMGDMGFLGFLIYISILANAFYTTYEIKTMVARHGPQLIWAGDLAKTVKIALQAFMIGGALVSAAYLDILFMLIMLLETIKQLLIRNQRLTAFHNHLP